MSARWRVMLFVAVTLLARAAAAEIEGALVVIEAAPGTPGSEPWGAPPRFALLADGQVFVGGTSHLETTRLSKKELRDLRRRIESARKAVERDHGSPPGPANGSAVRVRFFEGRPYEMSLDPRRLEDQEASGRSKAWQPLLSLVGELLRYDHPDLVRYEPAAFALAVQQRALVGGCRSWTFRFPIEEALAAPVAVYAADAAGWPTGASPASVCVGDRRFVVTLRPLLPGERP